MDTTPGEIDTEITWLIWQKENIVSWQAVVMVGGIEGKLLGGTY
jgi:hypothetical protein